jgi:hypothetical protein
VESVQVASLDDFQESCPNDEAQEFVKFWTLVRVIFDRITKGSSIRNTPLTCIFIGHRPGIFPGDKLFLENRVTKRR